MFNMRGMSGHFPDIEPGAFSHQSALIGHNTWHGIDKPSQHSAGRRQKFSYKMGPFQYKDFLSMCMDFHCKDIIVYWKDWVFTLKQWPRLWCDKKSSTSWAKIISYFLFPTIHITKYIKWSYSDTAAVLHNYVLGNTINGTSKYTSRTDKGLAS